MWWRLQCDPTHGEETNYKYIECDVLLATFYQMRLMTKKTVSGNFLVYSQGGLTNSLSQCSHLILFCSVHAVQGGLTNSYFTFYSATI